MVVLAGIFGVLAVVLVNIWLAGQRNAMANGVQASTVVVAAVPLKFVGEFVPALMFGEPGGLPNGPESVNDLTPSFGRDAPVNTIESFEPLKVMVIFVALGLKNGPTNGLFGAALWSNVKSGVTDPGSEPKPEVAISKE